MEQTQKKKKEEGLKNREGARLALSGRAPSAQMIWKRGGARIGITDHASGSPHPSTATGGWPAATARDEKKWAKKYKPTCASVLPSTAGCSGWAATARAGDAQGRKKREKKKRGRPDVTRPVCCAGRSLADPSRTSSTSPPPFAAHARLNHPVANGVVPQHARRRNQSPFHLLPLPRRARAPHARRSSDLMSPAAWERYPPPKRLAWLRM